MRERERRKGDLSSTYITMPSIKVPFFLAERCCFLNTYVEVCACSPVPFSLSLVATCINDWEGCGADNDDVESLAHKNQSESFNYRSTHFSCNLLRFYLEKWLRPYTISRWWHRSNSISISSNTHLKCRCSKWNGRLTWVNTFHHCSYHSQHQPQVIQQQVHPLISASQSQTHHPGKDMHKPKGRMSAYTFFVQKCRDEHRKAYPNENANFSEFSKKCAEKWKVRHHQSQLNARERNPGFWACIPVRASPSWFIAVKLISLVLGESDIAVEINSSNPPVASLIWSTHASSLFVTARVQITEH